MPAPTDATSLRLSGSVQFYGKFLPDFGYVTEAPASLTMKVLHGSWVQKQDSFQSLKELLSTEYLCWVHIKLANATTLQKGQHPMDKVVSPIMRHCREGFATIEEGRQEHKMAYGRGDQKATNTHSSNYLHVWWNGPTYSITYPPSSTTILGRPCGLLHDFTSGCNVLARLLVKRHKLAETNIGLLDRQRRTHCGAKWTLNRRSALTSVASTLPGWGWCPPKHLPSEEAKVEGSTRGFHFPLQPLLHPDITDSLYH
ncbi:hypothetical protein GWK47_054859 [Chionoecetes opilio]|uniref:Uncharacterized protein n=1 Tax=Chionoecetes opilio TaxID=41210 RepID=A0A8J4XY21_CHIOP|nr:hypothetical protein GWK47_054859 [Chionoecetes opilio]